MNPLVTSILLGIITLLFAVVAKLILQRMDTMASSAQRMHDEAMKRLDAVAASVLAVAGSVQTHIRDHASGLFERKD